MPDLLTMYAQAHPDKLAVIDDRATGDVRIATYAEFENVTNQLAHVLAEHGIGPGVKIVWCGQNSIGVANLVVAARKLGATAVPLNYRLSDEEAAYVTDHSDAAVVYVDAEFAPMFERVRESIPKVTDILVYDGPAPAGMTAIDPLIAAAPVDAPEIPPEVATGATMIYTSGTTGKPKGALRHNAGDPAQVGGHAAVHRLHARRHLPDHRPAVPQRARRVHERRHGPRPDDRACSASSTRRTGCGCCRRTGRRRRSPHRRRSG